MHVYPNQLSKALQQSLAPLYVLWGQCLFTQQSAAFIRHTAQHQGFEQRILFTIESIQFAWEAFFNEVQNHGLFAEKKIIELLFQCDNLSVTDKNQLYSAINHATHNPKLILILRANEKAGKSSWLKHLTQTYPNAVFVAHRPLMAQPYQHWLKDLAQQLGLTLEFSALTWLQQQTQGNPLAAQQSLLQLSFMGNVTVTQTQLQEIVDFAANYTVFDLQAAILEGKLDLSLQILNRLPQQGLELPLILWSLTQVARELLAALSAYPLNATLWPRLKSLYLNALPRYCWSKVNSYLQLANAIDTQFKRGQSFIAWQQLAQLTTAMATASATQPLFSSMLANTLSTSLK
jgi:DNA polymerase-3 subunit delta